MPPALQFVYAMLVLIAECNRLGMLMAAPNRELEPVIFRLLKSKSRRLGGCVSRIEGLYELPGILIALDEVLCLEI